MLGWLLRRNITQADSLIRSRLYNERTFYPVFMSDLRKAQYEVIIESPFITTVRTEKLLPTLAELSKRGVRVMVNTRHPDEHDNERSRLESVRMIAAMQGVGIKVLYTGRLHRKIALIDKRITYDGSLNVLSQVDSCEVMRRTVSKRVAGEMRRFIGAGCWGGNKYL